MYCSAHVRPLRPGAAASHAPPRRRAARSVPPEVCHDTKVGLMHVLRARLRLTRGARAGPERRAPRVAEAHEDMPGRARGRERAARRRRLTRAGVGTGAARRTPLEPLPPPSPPYCCPYPWHYCRRGGAAPADRARARAGAGAGAPRGGSRGPVARGAASQRAQRAQRRGGRPAVRKGRAQRPAVRKRRAQRPTVRKGGQQQPLRRLRRNPRRARERGPPPAVRPTRCSARPKTGRG